MTPKTTIEIIKDAGYVLVVRCKDCRFRGTDCCITKQPLMDNFYCWQGTPKEGR